MPKPAGRVSPTLAVMPTVPRPETPAGLTVLPPAEALRRAGPLPADGDMAIEGLTHREWTAFEQALAER